MMPYNSQELSGKLFDLGLRVLRLSAKMKKYSVTRPILEQFVRSGTSAGANYQEACGAESYADFIHKMSISFKELKETKYWTLLILHSDQPELSKEANEILDQLEVLIKIFAKSIITAKRNSGKY